jgi:predicted transcriptional regulator
MKKKSDQQEKDSPEHLMQEVLKMDRMLYMRIILEKKSITSLELTRHVLASKLDLKPEQIEDEKIAGHHSNINARLRKLVEIGILRDLNGEYSLSPIGFLFLKDISRMILDVKTLRKHKWFFDNHDYTVIPFQQFCEIHKLQFASQCKETLEYVKVIQNNTAKTKREVQIATERLHDLPGWIVNELIDGRISFQLLYQFKSPFCVNSDDEEEQNLWETFKREALPNGEFRYITSSDTGPVGIRIIDRKWAIFNLFEVAEKRMNRSISFHGKHEHFVEWVEDIFLNMWNKSRPLDLSKVRESKNK